MQGYNRLVSAVLAVLLLFASGSWGRATQQWTTTISCPAGTEYRDVRYDAGREEYCERRLPGSLRVKDGPSRSWYSFEHPAEHGSYRNGRKVGRWRECNRFDRCRDRVYEALSPAEKSRGGKPELPVTFANGRYTFDFRSCWSTWITHETAGAPVALNIGAGPGRCNIVYIPSDAHGTPSGASTYTICDVPRDLGVRAFDSADLRTALPAANLPQFCWTEDVSLTAIGKGGRGRGLTISTTETLLDSQLRPTGRGRVTLATVVDVECAEIEPQAGGAVLSVRLNTFVEKLVAGAKGPTTAEACGGRRPLTTLPVSRDTSGRTIFRYRLSSDEKIANEQRACVAEQITLSPTCRAR